MHPRFRLNPDRAMIALWVLVKPLSIYPFDLERITSYAYRTHVTSHPYLVFFIYLWWRQLNADKSNTYLLFGFEPFSWSKDCITSNYFVSFILNVSYFHTLIMMYLIFLNVKIHIFICIINILFVLLILLFYVLFELQSMIHFTALMYYFKTSYEFISKCNMHWFNMLS